MARLVCTRGLLLLRVVFKADALPTLGAWTIIHCIEGYLLLDLTLVAWR